MWEGVVVPFSVLAPVELSADERGLCGVLGPESDECAGARGCGLGSCLLAAEGFNNVEIARQRNTVVKWRSWFSNIDLTVSPTSCVRGGRASTATPWSTR